MQRAGFIRVSGDGTGFEEGGSGRPFHFVGANCYFLLTRAADPGLRHQCAAVLDDAAAAGLTVIRFWAFADGAAQWNALQPQPGVFDERVFRGLDWLLAAAAARRLRLLPVLTNYWQDFGGMRQYVAWARAQRGQQVDGAAPDSFYGDPACRSMFQMAAQALVGRTNTATGVRYRDDPTILAWSLANEPRCAGDHRAAAIPCWARWAAGVLKGLDPNHMVTLDSEGFLGSSTPTAAAEHNPYPCAGSGCDFAAEAGVPAIDFASCHVYPELWLPQADEQAQLRFALSWLDCHVQLSRQLGKPLVLSEWGKRRARQLDSCAPAAAGDAGRADFFEQVLAAALRHMEAGSGLAGTAFWMLAAPSYPDYDGFTVYLSGTAQQDSHTAAVLRRHAAAVAELNRRQPQARRAPAMPDKLLRASCPAGAAGHAGSHRAADLPSSSSGGHHRSTPDDVPTRARASCCPLM